jgi:hypothetical protein
MGSVPTVLIVHPTARGGFARINESDFDPAVHVLFEPTRLKAEQGIVRMNEYLAGPPADVSRETSPDPADSRVLPPIPAAPRKSGRPRKEG